MLQLKRLEVEGFGPFVERQVLEFPESKGVTVIYGENMRGKTSLLNAIRYAFFGTVLGRGSRVRRLHTISNRELASSGKYGFNVTLTFDYDGQEYELFRECSPLVAEPTDDGDYKQSVMLRPLGASPLGPQQREKVLLQVFPSEISRFFLFDGELLQEYEELIINESEAGHRISQAIERILGVPILQRGRMHLTKLADDADKQAAKEATKHQETQAIGNALQQATEQKDEHQKELQRLQAQLQDLNEQKLEIEQLRRTMQKFELILQERDDLEARREQAGKHEELARANLKATMRESWRSLVRNRVRTARAAAQAQANAQLDAFVLHLRATALAAGNCGICEQKVTGPTAKRLRATIPDAVEDEGDPAAHMSAAMSRLAKLQEFDDADNSGEVRQLCERVRDLELEIAKLRDRISDLNIALNDSDPATIRRSKASYTEVIERIATVNRGIEETAKKVDEKDQNIQRLKRKLESSGSPDLAAVQRRTKVLRETAEVFNAAVERYKTQLRARVEATASHLFLSMTTEKEDYAGLIINESYGLTIRHRDRRAEEARSAGAEHVVALALMGALQGNAPLRGPIVMDSPFGRLDEQHSANVIRTLPSMAEQVVLLVYEAEVGKDRIREILGNQLVREYELERVSARRTNIRDAK